MVGAPGASLLGTREIGSAYAGGPSKLRLGGNSHTDAVIPRPGGPSFRFLAKGWVASLLRLLYRPHQLTQPRRVRIAHRVELQPASGDKALNAKSIVLRL